MLAEIPSAREVLLRQRSSFSQSPRRWMSLPPAGRKARTRSSYADARSANGSRSLATGVAASRRTTSITTGYGSIVAAVAAVGRRSLSFRYSLFLTRSSACWPAVRHCDSASQSSVRGRRHCPSSRMPIGCLIPPRFAAGRAVRIVPSQSFPFSARPSPASLTGCLAGVRFLIRPGRCPG